MKSFLASVALLLAFGCVAEPKVKAGDSIDGKKTDEELSELPFVELRYSGSRATACLTEGHFSEFYVDVRTGRSAGSVPVSFDGCAGPACLVEGSVAVSVAGMELATLAMLLDNIPESRGPTARKSGQMCTSCFEEITVYRLDDESSFSVGCDDSTPTEAYEEAFERVVQFLNTLVPEPAPPLFPSRTPSTTSSFERRRANGSTTGRRGSGSTKGSWFAPTSNAVGTVR